MNWIEIVAFTTGLAGSLHCLGMCGPIALALPVGGFSFGKTLFSRLVYNSGRILTYSTLGLILGFIGNQFLLAGFQRQLSVLLGVFVLFNLFFTGIPSLSHKLGFVSALKKHFSTFLKSKKISSFFILGILNGFLPCGLVYVALAGATASSSPLSGMLYMFLFGLGTTPMMMGITMIMPLFTLGFRRKIQKILPVYTLILGLLLIIRGANLGIPYLSPLLEKITNTTDIPVCHGTSKI